MKENLTDKIIIYPNPASETISIDIDEVDFYLEIYNGNFELVKDINVRNRNERIDVSDLSSGQYYLLVRKAGKAIFRGFFNKIK